MDFLVSVFDDMSFVLKLLMFSGLSFVVHLLLWRLFRGS